MFQTILSLLPIFDWVLITSAKVSLLIIILLFVKLLFSNKLGATLNYLLWSVIIVALLLPWVPKSSFSIGNIAQATRENPALIAIENSYTSPVSNSMSTGASDEKVPSSPKTSVMGGTNAGSLPSVNESKSQDQITLQSISASPYMHESLFFIWVSGIIGLIAATVVINKRFSRTIKGQAITDQELMAGFETVKARLNITANISLTLTQATISPSLFGLFKPRLLIPVSIVKDLTPGQLNYVFGHELVHYKHRDILVNWVVHGLQVLYWFNPIIWYAFHKLREDQEIACDAMTLQYFGANYSKDYANTLIKLAENYSRTPKIANLAGLSGSKSLIKRRITSINNLRKKPLVFSIVIVGIVVLITVVTLTKANNNSVLADTTIPELASVTQEKNAEVNPSILHTFDQTTNWVNPNSSSYATGLSSVKTPKAPSAFEQSVSPQNGVASLYVSRGNGLVEQSDSLKKDWTQEIQFNDYSFEINGQVYSVPAEFRTQPLLLLPIDKGIVWAPIQEQPSDLSQLQQALQGATDIYYTPFNPKGGSLANGEQVIAQLPHSWMGLDGPVIASAWTGWLPKDEVAMAHVTSDTVYHLVDTNNNQLKSEVPVQGNVPGWPTLLMRDLVKPAYYQKPHYAAYIRSLTRTYGGFVLTVNFYDTQIGSNAGMSAATYYWSEQTGKWTPLAQNYYDQTLVGGTDIGSNGVYWMQPCSVGDGSGSTLDVSEMHFDPASLTLQSVWLGDWFYGDSFVDGNSWVVVLPNDMPNSVSEQSKKWTVYTP